jgi:hypothetical protein
LAGITPCTGGYIAGTTSFVDTFPSGCNSNPPTVNTAVTSSLNSAGISTYQLKMANNFTDVISPAPLTAARTQLLPDVNGIVPVSSYLNSAFDNFNRANGAVGANWSVTLNGLNVASNNIQGTATGGNNVGLWNANSFSGNQFAEATITALNGTTDFPGVAVNMSGTNNWYYCTEDTTTLFLQKNIAGSVTNTSGAVSGAVGDVLRIENNNGSITCYRNGASALAITDSTLTAGNPGVVMNGNVATMKNWSGGNLHPLAHLDAEQDWTKTQHFTQGIAFGSESLTASPRGGQNVFLPGALTATWTGSTWTLDKAITITRVQVQAKTAPSGCATNAVVQLTNGTTPINVTISAAANDSGSITQNYAAAASLTISVQTAAAGCTTSPADANVVVQYRMQ